MKEKLYTANQIAETLQLNVQYIYLLCRRGDIPFINISLGNKPVYRFDLKKVIEKMQNKSNK
jgi:hypothetical protein